MGSPVDLVTGVLGVMTGDKDTRASAPCAARTISRERLIRLGPGLPLSAKGADHEIAGLFPFSRRGDRI